uniref:Uncharacterized protein n=1 Tax=Anopheles atroparvus TaxID=41427 RepID=A0A182J686_ANOAO
MLLVVPEEKPGPLGRSECPELHDLHRPPHGVLEVGQRGLGRAGAGAGRRGRGGRGVVEAVGVRGVERGGGGRRRDAAVDVGVERAERGRGQLLGGRLLAGVTEPARRVSALHVPLLRLVQLLQGERIEAAEVRYRIVLLELLEVVRGREVGWQLRERIGGAERTLAALLHRTERPETPGGAGQRVLGLPARPILVVRMFLHVRRPQPLRLVDERALLGLGQQLPLRAEPLRDLRVVHLRVVLGDLAALQPRPHHERVHRPLDVPLLARRRLASNATAAAAAAAAAATTARVHATLAMMVQTAVSLQAGERRRGKAEAALEPKMVGRVGAVVGLRGEVSRRRHLHAVAEREAVVRVPQAGHGVVNPPLSN